MEIVKTIEALTNESVYNSPSRRRRDASSPLETTRTSSPTHSIRQSPSFHSPSKRDSLNRTSSSTQSLSSSIVKGAATIDDLREQDRSKIEYLMTKLEKEQRTVEKVTVDNRETQKELEELRELTQHIKMEKNCIHSVVFVVLT